jgi:hypothetical protein
VGKQSTEFQAGDRVRVIKAESPYTGCRGTVLESPGLCEEGQIPLGYYVAIDGENGVSRAFLASDLDTVVALKVRPADQVADRASG